MKKINLLIWFIVALFHSSLSGQIVASINGVGTNESAAIKRQEKNPDNLWGIDFYLISISGHYARKFANEFYIGMEAVLLPGYNWIILAGEHFTKENTLWSSNREHENFNDCDQLIFGHIFIRWRSDEIPLETEGGLRVAKYTRNVLYEDDFGWTNFYGAYMKPMLRIKKFGVGVRLDFGNMNSYSFKPSPEFVIIATPVLRFNFK